MTLIYSEAINSWFSFSNFASLVLAESVSSYRRNNCIWRSQIQTKTKLFRETKLQNNLTALRFGKSLLNSRLIANTAPLTASRLGYFRDIIPDLYLFILYSCIVILFNEYLYRLSVIVIFLWFWFWFWFSSILFYSFWSQYAYFGVQ